MFLIYVPLLIFEPFRYILCGLFQLLIKRLEQLGPRRGIRYFHLVGSIEGVTIRVVVSVVLQNAIAFARVLFLSLMGHLSDCGEPHCVSS